MCLIIQWMSLRPFMTQDYLNIVFTGYNLDYFLMYSLAWHKNSYRRKTGFPFTKYRNNLNPVNPSVMILKSPKSYMFLSFDLCYLVCTVLRKETSYRHKSIFVSTWIISIFYLSIGKLRMICWHTWQLCQRHFSHTKTR